MASTSSCRATAAATPAYGKIAAARALGIEVVMMRRPLLADTPAVEHVEGVVAWLAHLGLPAARGV